MLKLGEKTIGKLYVGDKPIYKAYWGDKLVYQAVKPVFLDYVEFDGNSWIDTGIVYPDGCDGTWTVKGKGNIDGVFRVLIATQATGGRYYGKGSNDKWGLGSTYYFDVNGDVLTEAQVVFSEKGVQATLDGVTLTRNSSQDMSVTIKLGGTNRNADSNNYFIGEVYGCKYIDVNNNLIQDLRPCIDPKGTVCMYDMVTKKYFYNQGIGTLTAGNKINFIDYIETDGNSYIDTGIILGINHKVSVKVNTPTSSSSAIQLFGNYSDSAGYFTCNIANSIGAISRFDGATYTGNISRSDGNFHTYSLDKNGILIDSDTILNWNKTPTDFQQSDSFYLFRARGSSSVTSNGTKISEEKVWENDTLVQHLKPCVVAGEAGFYDMVTGKVFTNAGTGTLKASGRFVESIIFDGNSYIDTLFKPHPRTTRTVLDCMLLDNTSSGGQGVFGSRPASVSSVNSMNVWFNTSDAPKTLRLDCTGNYQITKPDIVDITQRLLIDCLDKDATVNGVTYSSTVEKSNTTYLDYSMYLGNFNNVGNPYTKGCKMNVYRFTIYDNGVLIQDLKPYVDENGTACFKDVVTGELFYNQGTGTLTYTE